MEWKFENWFDPIFIWLNGIFCLIIWSFILFFLRNESLKIYLIQFFWIDDKNTHYTNFCINEGSNFYDWLNVWNEKCVASTTTSLIFWSIILVGLLLARIAHTRQAWFAHSLSPILITTLRNWLTDWTCEMKSVWPLSTTTSLIFWSIILVGLLLARIAHTRQRRPKLDLHTPCLQFNYNVNKLIDILKALWPFSLVWFNFTEIGFGLLLHFVLSSQ